MNILILLTLLVAIKAGEAAYPPTFFNESGCLYSYIEDGQYMITFQEDETQSGILTRATYEGKCTQALQPGSLNVKFNVQDNFMDSMGLEFHIKPSPSEGYWAVEKVTLSIKPRRTSQFPSLVIELKPDDIYAGERFSYSCSQLILQNLKTTKEEPHFRLSLKRFQLQPFGELPKSVFAPSYDCSVWITLPVLMGLLLMLFITFTVMAGVYLLLEQGNQTSDTIFSKQGGMLMNQAQLDATKG